MLMRFDPFRELDRTAEQLTQRLTSPSVPFDAVRRGNKVIVNFDLPGVAENSIDLTVERNVLTLKAERGIDWQDDDEVIANERRQGTFTRQLFVGDTLDTSKVEASYDRGVLTVTIPVAETAQPRKVDIAGTEGKPEAIQAESTEATASPAPNAPG
jgi:HSP20 family protein